MLTTVRPVVGHELYMSVLTSKPGSQQLRLVGPLVQLEALCFFARDREGRSRNRAGLSPKGSARRGDPLTMGAQSPSKAAPVARSDFITILLNSKTPKVRIGKGRKHKDQ